MGGEYYLHVSTNDNLKLITQEQWNQMLERLEAKFTDIRTNGIDWGLFSFDHEDWGFYFRKDSNKNGYKDSWEFGIPKVPNFNDDRLGIVSTLGGRSRCHIFEYIVVITDLLVELAKSFPGQFAIVICDGWSGYDDLDIYFDGTSDWWINIVWNKWPWRNNGAMTADEIVQNQYGLHESVINEQYTAINEKYHTDSIYPNTIPNAKNWWCIIC